MESNSGESDGNTEELTGRKKSRFKALKTRLFGKLKRKDSEGLMKQSQSASDMTAPQRGREGYDSEEDFLYPKGTLGSRALSHDSIFLADQTQSSAEPTRVLSQENVHDKIKALQLKLQQQNLRLGPAPLRIPTKRFEDSGTTSEDDGLPNSPPEVSFQDGPTRGAPYKFPDRHHSSLSLAGTGSEEEEQAPSWSLSRPLSPVSCLSSPPSSPIPPAVPDSLGIDFSSPAQFTPSLDTSAARHRMAVKPRKQRASNKGKRGPATVYRSRSESMHDLSITLSEGEELVDEVIDLPMPAGRVRAHSVQIMKSETESHNSFETDPAPLPLSMHVLDLENPIPGFGSGPDITENEDPRQKQLEELVITNPLFLKPMPQELIKSEPSSRTASIKEVSVDELTVDVDEPMSNDNSMAVDLHVCQEKRENTGTYITQTLEPVNPEQDLDVLSQYELPLTSTEAVAIMACGEKTDKMVSNPTAKDPHPTGSPTKYRPIPAPRARKSPLGPHDPISQRESSEFSGNETDEHNFSTTANPLLVEASKIDNKASGSFRFPISSAQRRSRTSESSEGESVDNPEEPPKTLLTFNEQDMTLDISEDERRKEAQWNLLTTAGKRATATSPVSRATGKPEETVLEMKEAGNKEKTSNAEEESRSAFGVKLRTTSMSLRYRAEVAQTEATLKRHSLEAGSVRSISENLSIGHAEPAQTSHPCRDEGSHFKRDQQITHLRSSLSLTSESRSTVVSPAGDIQSKEASRTLRHLDDTDLQAKDQIADAGSRPSLRTSREPEGLSLEPVWMSMAREKTRSHQQQHSSKAMMETSTPPQQSAPRSSMQPKPPARTNQLTLQPQHPVQPAAKPTPTATQSATQTPTLPKPFPRTPSDKPALAKWRTEMASVSQGKTESTALVEQKKDGLNVTEHKKFHTSCKPETTDGEWSNHISKPALSTATNLESHLSSPAVAQQLQQQPTAEHSQPSWMALAKRKSMAWSDKSMD
ncbi:uncharacterized protein KIAA1211-like isoform X2 [Denticeps clupeoides]|nr:uncharacterized protein KIAA1211-like isoform X2 [Denticeps clupeoides]XP_028810448.1 uncharacterized protein KIAA1211-like isoform X2 [Denticeps clupeoides]XP_028810449.1 uncharacterized protein KIAA1211-like isoform X2 [Denticeps clupeoides]XP_028810450.1 uncharacterized protein KIAA1211-like isoform X2 [Denticeps clupeoides]